MQYLRPYTYFLGKPGGGANLLYGALALLTGLVVPFVGQIVVLGYAAEVAEDLEHDPDLADHRDFTFNRLSEYLIRGVWPMLMQFLVGMAFLLFLILCVAVGVATYFLAGEDILIALIVGGVLVLPAMMFVSMVVWPMTLHAQLSRGFRLGAALRFTSAFLRKVGVQVFLALVVNSFVSFFLSLVGFMLCFVGVYAAMMIQVMAQEHFMLQLYRLYLDEGGERIEAPEDVADRNDFDDR